jgi:membrane-bound lytic murein transglycosylase D
MNSRRLIHRTLVLCCMYIPAITIAGRIQTAYSSAAAAGVPDKPAADNLIRIMDNSNVSTGLLELMQISRLKYIEGANLISAGDSEKAQKCFDEAVNVLLRSDWDLKSTPTLNGFFQDLIQDILKEEAAYFLKQADFEEENAAIDELQDLDLIPIEIDPALKDAVAADLARNGYEIPITINERVLKSINYWLNQGRKRFLDGLLRSGRYSDLIERIFREESIPLDLMYLALVESHFKPHAVSRAQAKGIWQFRRSTGVRYGLRVSQDVDERCDPDKSTRAAARYLKDLYAMFNDWNLALAAYNCGEGKVQRLINRTGLSDFWQLVDLRRRLPEETKNHVSLIQASIILARDPEKFGLPKKLDPPVTYSEVSVSKPIDLRAAAKALGISSDELKKLNPALRGLATPANYPDYRLKIPVDCGTGVGEKLASLPKAIIKPPPDFDGRHKIQPGETLSGIAARYGVSVAALEKANNLWSRHKIRAGAWLYVPTKTPAVKKISAVTRNSSTKSSESTAGKSKSKKGKTVVTENHSSGKRLFTAP